MKALIFHWHANESNRLRKGYISTSPEQCIGLAQFGPPGLYEITRNNIFKHARRGVLTSDKALKFNLISAQTPAQAPSHMTQIPLPRSASTPHTGAPRRVLLVDDHPAFRRGVAALISEEPDLVICGEASTAPMALEAMRRLKPDIAIIDISMPGTNGLELIKLMLAEEPKLHIL